jgi:hypothetical protein
MVRIKELDCILIVENCACFFEGNIMFFNIGSFFSLIPFKNKTIHMYIVQMIANSSRPPSENINAGVSCLKVGAILCQTARSATQKNAAFGVNLTPLLNAHNLCV